MQIDTMVICGMLSMEKQSDLREKLVINREQFEAPFMVFIISHGPKEHRAQDG
jgi:hypothetical protein